MFQAQLRRDSPPLSMIDLAGASCKHLLGGPGARLCLHRNIEAPHQVRELAGCELDRLAFHDDLISGHAVALTRMLRVMDDDWGCVEYSPVVIPHVRPADSDRLAVANEADKSPSGHLSAQR